MSRNRSLLFVLAALLVASAPRADANAADGASVATIAPLAKPAVLISGMCVDGVTIFIFRNTAQPWSSRGVLSVNDGDSGSIISVRSLSMTDGQTVSFHVPGDRTAESYRVQAQFPDGTKAGKHFAGNCQRPG